MSSGASQKGTRMTIVVIEGLVGIAALIAGLLFIVRPDGSLLGMPRGTLSGTGFRDYLVPGILLVVVIAGVTLLGAGAVGLRTRNAAELVLAGGATLVLFEGVEEALIGFSPERPIVVLLGLVLIALSLRLAGPMEAAHLELAGDTLVIGFPGASALLAFKRPLAIPLAHVVQVDRATHGPEERLEGFLGLGTWLPGVVGAPRFRHGGGRAFWNVSDPANAIVVQLEQEHYSRLIVDVADPDGTIAAVRAAIAAPRARRRVSLPGAGPRRPGLTTLLLLAAVTGLAAGGVLRIVGAVALSNGLWGATAALSLVPTTFSVARDLMRRRAGVDIVAVLALAGALGVGEYLAGAVIALMLATGRELEARASARARRELSALLSRAPAVVHRIEGDTLMTQPIDAVRSGDVLIVAPGEVVPVDGLLASDNAVFDESALTGESALVERVMDDPVRSGGVNAGGAFRLRSTATADASTYAGIVRLVRQAQESRAPLVRVADRFALWFVPLTIAMAVLSGILARDPVRAVAVLVVATPCPLILAAPIALVGGMSRAARRGIVVKGGAALETLGRAEVLLFDKTGTLTEGRARVADIETDGTISADEVLRLGASLDQASTHALARATVQAARARGLRLDLPDDVHEDPGKGVRGSVAGRRVMIGRASYVADGGAVPPWAARVRRRTAYQGLANVFVGVDGILVGALVLEDPIRPDSGRAIARLRTSGMRRMVMVTGDHPDVAQAIASAIGVDAVYAERSPAEKVEVVREERERGIVVMVGDGINDAPALAAADVGVAMGVRGATASSEAADVVLMVDRIDRLAEAVLIARRSHHIAVQSIAIGMGLSLVAMGIAAVGWLVPVVGARRTGGDRCRGDSQRAARSRWP